MRIQTQARVALQALRHLTHILIGTAPRMVSLHEIAELEQISLPYLEALFAKLRRAGLVKSAKGPGGGYCLMRPPSCISIGDVVRAVDVSEHKKKDSVLWQEINGYVMQKLDRISLCQITEVKC